MIKTFLILLKKINLFTVFKRPLMGTDDALNIISEKGYEAHFWLPGVNHHDDRKLWDALETLKYKGFIITDTQGCLVGKIAKARLSTEEKAEARRAVFKLIESK